MTDWIDKLLVDKAINRHTDSAPWLDAAETAMEVFNRVRGDVLSLMTEYDAKRPTKTTAVETVEDVPGSLTLKAARLQLVIRPASNGAEVEAEVQQYDEENMRFRSRSVRFLSVWRIGDAEVVAIRQHPKMEPRLNPPSNLDEGVQFLLMDFLRGI